jgi:uncharacterized protein involved in exopolysaccharide biosynthesis
MSYRARVRERALGRSHSFDLPPYEEVADAVPARKGVEPKLALILTGATAGGAIVSGVVLVAIRLL